MTQKLIIFIGAPCSGKSTLARHVQRVKGYERVSTDEAKEEYRARGEALSIPEMHSLQRKRISALLEQGCNVISDANSAKPSHRQELLAIAKEYGAQPIMIYCDCPFNTLLERMESRNSHVSSPEQLCKYVDEIDLSSVADNLVRIKTQQSIDDSMDLILERLQCEY